MQCQNYVIIFYIFLHFLLPILPAFYSWNDNLLICIVLGYKCLPNTELYTLHLISILYLQKVFLFLCILNRFYSISIEVIEHLDESSFLMEHIIIIKNKVYIYLMQISTYIIQIFTLTRKCTPTKSHLIYILRNACRRMIHSTLEPKSTKALTEVVFFQKAPLHIYLKCKY